MSAISASVAAAAAPPKEQQQQQQRDTAAAAQFVNMAPRLFDISQLPSLKEGMSMEEESMKRRKTCRFIEEAGRILKLPRVAVATAMVFFHRFYAKHSFQQHDRFEVAVASLLLAAKTEESPKKLNVVIDECHKLKQRGMQAGRISQNSPSAPAISSTPASLDPKGEEYLKLKERILLLERVILHTIGFELSIDHPYKFLVEQIKKMIHNRQLEYITPPAPAALTMSVAQTMSKMLNELVQLSLNCANDSMHTCLCLQFPPQKIATACVYLAGHFAKVRPTTASTSNSNNNNNSISNTTTSWLDILDPPIEVEALTSVCLQVLDLIAERKGGSTDEKEYQQIKAELEQLQQKHKSPLQPPPRPPPPRPPAALAKHPPSHPPPPPPPPPHHAAKRSPPPPPPPGAAAAALDARDPKRYRAG